jgi:hypothetical protein
MVYASRLTGLGKGLGRETGQSEPWIEEGICNHVRASILYTFVSPVTQVYSFTLYVLLLKMKKYKCDRFIMA